MIYIFSVFISAFLLFQIQLISGKAILPWFGGGASVWTTCMLFFQFFLLAGYTYTYVLTKFLSLRQQTVFHFLLLAASSILLSIDLVPNTNSFNSAAPITHIFLILTINIGLPFLLLSSTAPLLQLWFSNTEKEQSPYKLYSYSNVGSLLGLISYPVLIEPMIGVKYQGELWSNFYVLFVIFILIICVKTFMHSSDIKTPQTDHSNSAEKLSNRRMLIWFLLSSTAVTLLISITNALTQNVPSIPFLWALPLCIYLLSFIICFHDDRWYTRWYWIVLFNISVLLSFFLFFIGSVLDIVTQIILYSLVLLSSSMICCGELYRLKPHPNHLTHYYLFIALGGFFGGLFVSIVAPNIFIQYLEFPIGLLSTMILAGYCVFYIKGNLQPSSLFKYQLLKGAWFASIPLSIFLFISINTTYQKHDIASSRNFYGTLSVKDVVVDEVKERRLVDGTTNHGTQLLSADKSKVPTSYFRKDSGVGLVLEHSSNKVGRKIGVIGLGAGTLAAYGKNGDSFKFYELNPDVESMALNYFSYLDSSLADTSIVLGDGRMSLDKELKSGEDNNFDILVIDAFSNDSIPMHLLTREAFALYDKHLSEDGTLAIHISNRHLDLSSVGRAGADHLQSEAFFFKLGTGDQQPLETEWVIITRNPSLTTDLNFILKTSPWPIKIPKKTYWTDDFASLIGLLKF